MIIREQFSVQCKDGVILKGVLLIPETPKAVVQFNGGTAVKKEFYQPFLEYLSEHNYACCLWDYRGNGASAPADLAASDFTFSEYGTKDMPAIRAYLIERFKGLPLLLFTHSAGGQQIGLMPSLEGYKGMVAFAVSTGYFPDMPFGYRLKSAFFFYLFSPVSVLLKGYVVAKQFGIMENLPRNVMGEWRSWCGKKDYLFDPLFYGKTISTGHYQHMPFTIHIIWTIDDPIANERSVTTFWSHVKSMNGITFDRLTPKELGLKTIGHFGFFKKKMKATLWDKGLHKLDEFLASD